MNNLNAQNQFLRSENLVLESKITSLKNELLWTKNSQKNASVDTALEDSIKVLQVEITELKKQNDILNGDLQELTAKRMEDASKVRSIEEKYIRANKQLTHLTQKLEGCALREGELQIQYEDVRMKLRCFERLVESGKLIA